MRLSPGKFLGMKRLSDNNGIFLMTAVDQRPPIKKPIADYLRKSEAPWKDVANFKKSLVDNLQEQSSALLLDPHYALPISMDIFNPRKGLIVTLEDSIFEERTGGRISKSIDNWSVAKIKKMGADAVKVLAWYRPDADKKIIESQKDYVKKIGEECLKYDILFLFELLVYPFMNEKNYTDEYLEMKNKKTDHVLQSIQEFSKNEYGVDVFKLESPVNVKSLNDDDLISFKEMDKLTGRPWVMLSAGAGKEEFKKVLSLSFKAGCSGFLAGRAIWLEALSKYPDWKAINFILKNSSAKYLNEIANLAKKQALPWYENQCFSNGGNLFPYRTSDFRNMYVEGLKT